MRYYDINTDKLPWVNFDNLVKKVKSRVAKIASYRTRDYRSFDRIMPYLYECLYLFSEYRRTRVYINIFGGEYPFA